MEEKKDKIEEGKIGQETDLITLSQASKMTGYTPEHLNLLCRKGVLKGEKIGRNWHTTKKWLAEFLASPEMVEKKNYKKRKKFKESLIEETENILSEVPVVVVPQKTETEIEKEAEPKIVRQVEFIEMPIPVSRLGWMKIPAQFMVIIIISFSIFFGAAFLNYLRDNTDLQKNLPSNLSGDTFLTTDKNGKVEGQESVNGQANVQAAVASSENYEIKEISFGGVPIASANNENIGLEVSDVNSQNFISKDGNAEVLISWKTNKLAVSDIVYSKKEIDTPKTLSEKYYGFNHSVVLSDLELGSSYVYQINCKDQWGNPVSSDKFGLYTGTKVLSVFDLIIKALNDTFGWAMKK